MMKTNSSWPPFLDLIDHQPLKAADQFYRYVVGLLEVSTPRTLKIVPLDERKDLFHDIVVHCIRDNFRVLRQYEDVGRPFAAWFYFVANNKIRDYLDKSGRTPETISSNNSDPAPSDEAKPNPETDHENRELLQSVNAAIAELDDYCQVLLRLAGEEYKPREMTGILGWAKEKAKKISNDLGYCRRKLANLLFERGIDIEAVSFGN